MAVEEFRSCAESFVALVDGSANIPRDQLVSAMERQLVELYGAALALTLPSDVRHTEPPNALTDDEAARLHRRLSRQFGDWDSYSFVFDPFDPDDPAPVNARLSDDVADIYRELQNGLAAFRAGDDDEALWEWTFGFDHHWGRHAAHALVALHVLITDRLGRHS